MYSKSVRYCRYMYVNLKTVMYPIRIWKKNKTLNSLRKMKKNQLLNHAVKQTMSESSLTTDIKVWTLLYLLYK